MGKYRTPVFKQLNHKFQFFGFQLEDIGITLGVVLISYMVIMTLQANLLYVLFAAVGAPLIVWNAGRGKPVGYRAELIRSMFNRPRRYYRLPDETPPLHVSRTELTND